MLGVVIVSYRSDDLTVRFVREELAKVTIPHRVVVVANGYDAARAQQLADRIPEAVVLPAENRGFAAGNNLGVKWLEEHDRPTHILLTNNDIRFRSERVVETLVETAVAHPEAGAVGPEIIGPDGNRQGPEPYMSLWDRYVWMYLSTPFLSAGKKRVRFALDYPSRAVAGFHYKLSGAFLLVDAEAFREAGLFDERTFLYGEENILSDRFARIGRKLYFDPSVTVLHDHGQTIGRHHGDRERALMQFDSMACYYRNYRGNSALSLAAARCLYSLILKVK